ncbi:MAG: SCO family protein [Verrucomicrobiales bacterium]
MTQRSKIITIYAVVGLICALIIGLAFLLAGLKQKQQDGGAIATDIGKEEVPVLKTLEGDLELVKQDGETVRVSDLKDKVWVAAQFYATCPMCAARNGEQLVNIYRKYEQHEDFRVVCFSIDPEHDTLEHLKALEENLDVDGDKWWFVKGDPEAMKTFMIEQMGYPEIRERTDQAEIDIKGRWAHDLGIEVFDGMDLLIKANLDKNPYNDPEAQRALLDVAIERALQAQGT